MYMCALVRLEEEKQEAQSDTRNSTAGTFCAHLRLQHLACASSWSQLHLLRPAAIRPQRMLRT